MSKISVVEFDAKDPVLSMARAMSFAPDGSLGVVLWCAAKKFIARDEAEACLTWLEQSSLWLSPRVRSEARVALARLFSS